MFNKTLARAAFVTSLALFAAPSFAQDFTGMDLSAMYNSWASGQNTQMNTMTQNIVQQNLQNPQVQAMYQQYLQSGGTASPEDFAYMYAATGGFTPEGTAYFQQTEANNAAKEAAAYGDYQAAQAGSAAAISDWSSGDSSNMNEAGNGLMGNGTYTTPGGSNQVLPSTWQAGGTYSYNNQTYYVDPSGAYYQVDPNNAGWMYPVYPTYGQ